METSITIAKIAKALLDAQMEMCNAVKDSKNPFFKSTYADLNSVREACVPSLNKYGISIIQPIVFKEGKNFVNTILLHESGEFLSGFTEIVYSKQNDAQSQGSGITYSRRYGMQSMCNIGVEDDDGEKASNNAAIKKAIVQPAITPAPSTTNLELSEELKTVGEQVRLIDNIDDLSTYWGSLSASQKDNGIIKNLISKRKIQLPPKV